MLLDQLYDYLRSEDEEPLLDRSNLTQTQLNRVQFLDFFEGLAMNHVREANHPSILIKPNNNQFHFLYINKDSLNAFATIFQDIDVVALNIGTIIEIDNYFIRAVNTGIFEWLDNQLARRTLVNVLTIMAIEFIILHELGHIYNGHLEFDSVSRLRRMLLHEGNLESRTIEMDADAYATTRSFSKYLQQNIESEMKIIASNKLDMLRFWVFATHSFFSYLSKHF